MGANVNENNQKIDLEEDIDRILDWLELQPHLPKITDRKRIRKYLLGCKYSVEKVKRKIDYHYTVRNTLIDIFGHRDPMAPGMQKIFKDGDALTFPELTPDGYRVLYYQLIEPNMDILEYFKLSFSMFDILVQEDECTKGIAMVNASTMCGAHLISYTALGLNTIKNSVEAFMNGYPMQIKAIVYINSPSIVESFLAIFKPFLPKKLLNRIVIHSKGEPMDKVYKIIPRNVLPSDFGGSSISLQEIRDSWKKKIESYRDFLIAEQDMVADESKRPGGTKDNIFGGVDGTFKKLAID